MSGEEVGRVRTFVMSAAPRHVSQLASQVPLVHCAKFVDQRRYFSLTALSSSDVRYCRKPSDVAIKATRSDPPGHH